MGSILKGIIGEECYKTIVYDGQYMNMPCLKVVISKGIGYGMIVFSSILKLPQIIKIMSAKSVEGLSPASFYMEVLAFTFTIVYNYILKYPFSSYGESVVINIQNIFLVFLLWSYIYIYIYYLII